ncbi:type II toxin-antitoxin system prevent-host-death family antitoxin [Niveispirillum sp.]|uniref:type II toxin-antitoxin system prevent-host-death family antitoxin n=1 Tax=Niveispirillum sp. TaxID=1917217 RepID=UPI001B63DD10|nr:type II toxin-antitoxin system prevent-host-death family antitoxin [Niveispirillum sp.]MBP7335757.1 type II toxin-antitoxin system prevent-host-death family antitoxin [Niveispirillum sp.]
MRTVTIQEARTNLTKLVEKAAKGDAFIIAEAGKPLVKVIALEPANSLHDSIVSIWEVAVKFALEDFRFDPQILHEGLQANGYQETPMTAQHAITVGALPQSTGTRSTGCW